MTTYRNSNVRMYVPRMIHIKTLNIRNKDFTLQNHLAVLLCYNMKDDFENPVVIGKSVRPHCFRN